MDLILFETPLQWECRYQLEAVRSPSIIADALISRKCALSYYLFVQKQITKIFGLALLFFGIAVPVSFGPKKYLNISMFFFIFGYATLSALIPVMYISILKELCKKFDFLYLMGNSLVFCIGIFIVFKGFYPNYLRILFFVFSFVGYFWICAMDALPLDILPHKQKSYWCIVFFFMNMFLSFVYIFTPVIEDKTEKKWEFFLGWRVWDVASIIAGASLNETMFMGRIVYFSFIYPGHYTIIRFPVKQKSLKVLKE